MNDYTPIALSDEQILTTLREVVAEQPGYVYTAPDGVVAEDTMCFYVHTDDEGNQTPGCLVGVVLNRLGVPLDVLSGWEGNGAYAVSRSVARVSERAASMLMHAQDAQDNGATWSAALERAERWAPTPLVV